MCGDLEDNESEDILGQLARHLRGEAPEGLGHRANWPQGARLGQRALFRYMDDLFADLLAMSVNDAATASPASHAEMIRSQAIVFARAAGMLAGHLGGRGDPPHPVMSALLDGYSNAES
jgi:hypothetical protein